MIGVVVVGHIITDLVNLNNMKIFYSDVCHNAAALKLGDNLERIK